MSLESDLKDIKREFEYSKNVTFINFQLLLEKSLNDDEFIRALKGEIEKLKLKKPEKIT